MDVTLSSFRRHGRFKFDDTLLQHTDCMKLLGVYISYNLSWNNHVDFVRTKSAQLLGFIFMNLKGCSARVLCQTYLALIRPIMMHGTPGWHPTTKMNVLKLQRIQNRTSRYAFGKNFTHELTKKVLSIHSMLQFNDLMYYRCYNRIVDCACDILSSVREGKVILGEGGICRLIPPLVRTSMYQNGFIYRSVALWNNLPAHVKQPNPSDYKCMLKSYLLNGN
jgi:hypothetical protein